MIIQIDLFLEKNDKKGVRILIPSSDWLLVIDKTSGLKQPIVW